MHCPLDLAGVPISQELGVGPLMERGLSRRELLGLGSLDRTVGAMISRVCPGKYNAH